jgi:hypothetical protein
MFIHIYIYIGKNSVIVWILLLVVVKTWEVFFQVKQ